MGIMDLSIGDIGGVFTSIREAITGEKIKDPTELAKIDLQLAQLQQAANSGQLKINEIEAASDNLFVAGWRPFIGWTCGISIAYAFVLQPIIEWFVTIYGITTTTPEIDSDTLYQLVLAMLGMAGLRTYEKQQKVAREK